MGRPKRRAASTEQNPAGASGEKKFKLEPPKIDDFEIQFEWEGDQAKWVRFSKKFNRLLATEYNAGKKQVELVVPTGATLIINFEKMVQKNKKTGYQRRIRVALKSDKNTDFHVLEWQNQTTWNPYSIENSVRLENEFQSGSEGITIKSPPGSSNTVEIDLKKMTQTNLMSKMSCSIRRQKPVSDIPPDYEDEEEKNTEEEQEKEENGTKKNGKAKGRSGGKSKNTASDEGTSKSAASTEQIPAGASVEKKLKLEPPKIDDFEVQFEWEEDQAKWVQFSKKFNRLLATEFNAGKKQVELVVPTGATLIINFEKMVQKNKKTGYQRRIRVAIKSDKNTDFHVMEWQNQTTWTPYSIEMSVRIENEFQSGSEGITIKSPPGSSNTVEIDLKKMTQTNLKSKKSCSIRRQKPVSDIPPDYEDEEEKNTEEEQEKEENGTKKSGKAKGRSGGKSKNTASEEGTSKSTVRTVVVKKGSAPVDDQCPVAAKSFVYESGKTVWDCMLNQTNIANNNNKYYLIQLLQEEGKKAYYVWQRWGRVGYKGQTNLLNCGGDLDAATKAFTKKFRDKTGNDWSDKDNFVKVSGKYDLLKMDYSVKDEEDEVDAPLTKSNSVKEDKQVPDSKLDIRVQQLVQLICDIKSMEDAVIEMKYDAKKAPLGKLTKDQIKAGYEALKNIESLIQKKDFGRNLSDACSEFYTRIPHEFGMQVPPLIRTPQMVKEKIALLEALEDIEIAIKMLKGGDMSENPIDRHYHQLHCSLDPLDHTSDEFKLVDKYLQQTHASTHNQYKMELVDVFTCSKDGEATNFQDYGNRMLLWHGSRLTNWAGILGQGLRIAPPEAPVTGYMFGKGVYFADMSSKSGNYCFATKTKNTGLLLLCDVSLGNMDDKLAADYNADKLPKGKHSVRGVGKIAPDPAANITLPDGLVVPVGKCKDTGANNPAGFTLNYNEYIVYDVNQVRMKYLVNVKFNFK